MEVRGEEFIKNLEIEKEKVRLKEQTDSLDAQKQKAIFNSSNENINDIKLEQNNNSDFQELDDIILNNNTNNKQKYIVFGFALVLLFLITIITIRLIQEPQTQNDFASDDIIENIDKDILQTTTKKIDRSLDIDKIIQAEDTVNVKSTQAQEQKRTDSTSDVFGIEKKEKIAKVENVITEPVKIAKKQKTTTKKLQNNVLEKNPIKEVNLNKLFDKKPKNTLLKPKGWYIQVGAFTKKPNKRLLNTLKKTKYTFVLHKMKIKGKIYTKVLVGSYKSKKEALTDLSNVRKVVHNSGAYILRFK